MPSKFLLDLHSSNPDLHYFARLVACHPVPISAPRIHTPLGLPMPFLKRAARFRAHALPCCRRSRRQCHDQPCALGHGETLSRISGTRTQRTRGAPARLGVGTVQSEAPRRKCGMSQRANARDADLETERLRYSTGRLRSTDMRACVVLPLERPYLPPDALGGSEEYRPRPGAQNEHTRAPAPGERCPIERRGSDLGPDLRATAPTQTRRYCVDGYSAA